MNSRIRSGLSVLALLIPNSLGCAVSDVSIVMAPEGAGGGGSAGGSGGTGTVNAQYWYVCDCTCVCATSGSTNWTRRCANPNSTSCSSCSVACTDICSSQSLGAYESGTGSCSLSTVPATWSCDLSAYGSGDGCDCGCGAHDPDCTSSASSACTSCNDDSACSTSCSQITATNNATCTNVPAAWHCAPGYYGAGDGCDCGCGALDPDCTSSASSACDYCNNGGGCTFSCSSINATNNAICN